jgi:hypothetical protein
MRLAFAALGMIALVGCSRDGIAPVSPTSPPVALSSSAWLWMMVAEDSGLCIADATIEVIAGQSRGLTAKQTQPCDVWDVGGIYIKELEAGAEMTVRASAPGYAAQEKVVVPKSGPQQATIFVLTKS